MDNLLEKWQSAHAKWAACPASRKEEKGLLAAEVKKAAAAVQAAKKAANPAPVHNTDPTAALMAQRRRVDAQSLRDKVAAAVALYNRAQEYPRCGQNWGRYDGEQAAKLLIKANFELAQEIAREK